MKLNYDGKLVPRGNLATLLRGTQRKVLYRTRALLLGFNVSLDECLLNSGF